MSNNGLDNYLNAVLNLFGRQIKKTPKKYSERLNESLINDLLDLDGPRKIQRHFTKEDMFVSKLFFGIQEIYDSIERLKTYEIYTGRYPYSNTTISKSQHLRTNIENYLGEFYLLKERVNSYLTTIGRLYRKDPRHKKILGFTRPLFKIIPSVFDSFLKARGIHVHQRRYTDKDIDRLNLLEFYDSHASDILPYVDILYENHYKETRKKWKNLVKTTNGQIKVALDLCFENIHPLIFTKNGNARYPRQK